MISKGSLVCVAGSASHIPTIVVDEIDGDNVKGRRLYDNAPITCSIGELELPYYPERQYGMDPDYDEDDEAYYSGKRGSAEWERRAHGTSFFQSVTKGWRSEPQSE